jgi:hypothetical protein
MVPGGEDGSPLGEEEICLKEWLGDRRLVRLTTFLLSVETCHSFQSLLRKRTIL